MLRREGVIPGACAKRADGGGKAAAGRYEGSLRAVLQNADRVTKQERVPCVKAAGIRRYVRYEFYAIKEWYSESSSSLVMRDEVFILREKQEEKI